MRSPSPFVRSDGEQARGGATAQAARRDRLGWAARFHAAGADPLPERHDGATLIYVSANNVGM
jgi:hypothetical protein